MTTLIDIFGMDAADWMNNPHRNCAIPDEFDAKEAGEIADQWFPTELGEIRYAKRLCGGCPSEMQCFKYAYERPELEGIWGATSKSQRDKLRNDRKRKAAAKQRKAGDDAA